MSVSNSEYLDPDSFSSTASDRLTKYEIYEEGTWEIFDPWNAKTIAVFHDRAHAYAYLKWINSHE